MNPRGCLEWSIYTALMCIYSIPPQSGEKEFIMFSLSTILGVTALAVSIFTSMAGIYTTLHNQEEQKKQQSTQNELEQQNIDIANKSIDTQQEIAEKNFGLQKEQFEYQKQLNELQMQREDTAMQRQVSDLKAAGLSPLMVSGGSSTGQYLSASAPQMNGSGILQAMSNLMGVKSDMASRRQAAYQFERQQHLQLAQQFSALSSLKLQNENQNLQNKLLKQQYDYNEKHGVRDPNPMAALTDAIMAYMDQHAITPPSPEELKERAEDLKETVSQKVDEIREKAAESPVGSLDNMKEYASNNIGQPIKRAFSDTGSAISEKWKNTWIYKKYQSWKNRKSK